MGGDGDISNSSQGMQVGNGKVWFKELRGAKGAGQITPNYSISQGLQEGCDMGGHVATKCGSSNGMQAIGI